jgi:hypothetical protein
MRDKIEVMKGSEELGAAFGLQADMQATLERITKDAPEETTYADVVGMIWNDPAVSDLEAAGLIMFIGAMEEMDRTTDEVVAKIAQAIGTPGGRG